MAGERADQTTSEMTSTRSQAYQNWEAELTEYIDNFWSKENNSTIKLFKSLPEAERALAKETTKQKLGQKLRDVCLMISEFLEHFDTELCALSTGEIPQGGCIKTLQTFTDFFKNKIGISEISLLTKKVAIVADLLRFEGRAKVQKKHAERTSEEKKASSYTTEELALIQFRHDTAGGELGEFITGMQQFHETKEITDPLYARIHAGSTARLFLARTCFLKLLGTIWRLAERISNDLAALEKKDFDLSTLVQQSAISAKNTHNDIDYPIKRDGHTKPTRTKGKHPVKLEFQIELGPHQMVHGHEAQIYVALRGIFKNFPPVIRKREVQPEKQQIKITIFKESDVIYIQISDTLGGVKSNELRVEDPEKIAVSTREKLGSVTGDVAPANPYEEIFKPQITGSDAGSGLGLPETRAIINEHRGEVIAFPNGANGTHFLIGIPAANNNDTTVTKKLLKQKRDALTPSPTAA